MDNGWSSSAVHHRRFVTWEYASGVEKIDRLIRGVELSGKKVLDLGCGDGRVSAELIAQGAEVWGIDADEKAVGLAVQKGVKAELGDLEKPLPFEPEEFDLVLCLDTLEHIYDEAGLVGEIERVLKPSGFALLSIPNHFDIRNRLAFLFGGGIIHWAHKKYPGTTVWGYSHVRFPRLVDLQALLKLKGLYLHAVQYNFNSGGVVPRRLTPGWFRAWLVATFPNLFSGKFVVRIGKQEPGRIEKIISERTVSGM